MATREEKLKYIARYLTKQFIWHEPGTMPDDECIGEAEHILDYIESQEVEQWQATR